MAAKTYKARVVVLKKTKLGEKDLIVTLLDKTGSLRKAVAKGARKPGGSYAAKLELFSVVDAMFAQGRSLDVVTDARIAHPEKPAPCGLDQTACASPIAELICSVAQEGLEHERLFDLTVAAFDAIAVNKPETALAITAASLMKAVSMAGFRPSFDECVSCGESISYPLKSAQIAFSFPDGGVVCGSCRKPADAIFADAQTIEWARAMLSSTFADIAAMGVDPEVSFAVLELDRQWIRTHVGKSLKSLEFLFASGLY